MPITIYVRLEKKANMNRLVNTELWNDENIIENFTAEELKEKAKN